MGLTSRAKMQQVGVSEVIWGRLTDAMRIEEGGELSRAAYVHPRTEPEIAFVLRRPLEGRVTAAEALAAVEAVAPAIEMIDSRYRNFRFALADVVADNASSSGLSAGGLVQAGPDVANLGMLVEVDESDGGRGFQRRHLGHPLRALVAAARLVTQAGSGWRPATSCSPVPRRRPIRLAPGQYLAR